MTICVVKVNGLRTPEQRATVCYVGRAFAGWPASPWGNPFKPQRPNLSLSEQVSMRGSLRTAIGDCLKRFSDYAEAQPDSWLASLWEACDHGRKPLGCWCIDHGGEDDKRDCAPLVCHGQILAAMLYKRFVRGNNKE